MDYFDIDLTLTDDEVALKRAAHKFAEEVMRPVAKQLDRMTPEEAVAPDSPLWDFLRQAYQLGYHSVLFPDSVGGLGLNARQVHVIFEELAWGSFGLALLLAVVGFPFFFATLTGDEELIEKFVLPFTSCTDGSIRGCWAITEPDHGSDLIGLGEAFFADPKIRLSVRARPDGDKWILKGQKAAWVSNGAAATHALLHVNIDPSLGIAGGGICVVPLDLPGVSKGRPLDKIGQRDLNQAELYFDDVAIPKSWMMVDPDFYVQTLETILAYANLCMSMWSTGLARAAFDEAFAYCKERVQGGKPLIEHATIKQRLFKMFSRVEVCRSFSRSVAGLNFNISPPSAEYSIAAKVTNTQLAYENADEAIQLLGGNGLTKEYIVEKLFRDARATLIEDGTNDTLARHGGHLLMEAYPRSREDV